MSNQRTIPRVCPTCGSAFLAWRSARKQPSDGRFCSRQCIRRGKTLARLERFLAEGVSIGEADACWPCPVGSRNHDGYVRVKIGGNRIFAHKLAWQLGNGDPIPPQGKILHVCDVPDCIRNDTRGTYEVDGVIWPRLGHLYLGTIAINNADKAMKDRATRGSAYWSAKLTDEAVTRIRADCAAGVSQAELARRHRMSSSGIHSVVHRQSWRHVE